MADLKLFRISDTAAEHIVGDAIQVEKSLQVLFESNLEVLLGVRFLASEHSTGPVHGGRIDTLGIDEDNTPVIIEYKRATNENVINQGLFYLDWLLDHRKDFDWLVMTKLGKDVAERVDWPSPRLLCIAGDFTKYDVHAIKQIDRSLELLRYRRFGGDLLLLELVHAAQGARQKAAAASVTALSQPRAPGPTSLRVDKYLSARIAYRLQQASADLLDIYEATRSYLTGLGDDVQEKHLEFYVAFKRIRNFACVEVYPQEKKVTMFLKVDPKTVSIVPGFTRDMSHISHFGTGDLEVVLRSLEDLESARPLLDRAYQAG